MLGDLDYNSSFYLHLKSLDGKVRPNMAVGARVGDAAGTFSTDSLSGALLV